MDKGLGELGFWLAVGIIVAAMIIGGALKKPDPNSEKWKERMAMGGSRMSVGQTMAFAACVATVMFSFMGGFLAFAVLSGHGTMHLLPPWCLTPAAQTNPNCTLPAPLSPFVIIGVPLGI